MLTIILLGCSIGLAIGGGFAFVVWLACETAE